MSAKLTILALVLFLVGFGLLLFSFLELIHNIRRAKARGFVHKKSLVWLRVVLIGSGVVLIVAAQSMFWFNSSLKEYSPLNKNIPLASISFYDSDTEMPRMILKTFDADNQPLIADEVFLEDTVFQIEMEVIKFKRLGNLFELDEIYRFSRIIYINDYVNDSNILRTTSLVGDEDGITDYIKSMKKIFTIAHYKTVLTDPLRLDVSKTIDITYNDLGIIRLLPEGAVGADHDE